MNNIQLYLTIGIPSFVALISWVTVILAWLSNRTEMNRMGDKFDRLNEKVDSLADSLRAEMVLLRNDHHKDNLALMGLMIPLHERMARLESSN
jgi:hypothetical protein